MGLLIGIIIGLIILVLLVVVHELGHAIVARRNGVVVEEFGVGFPPKAWARKLKNGVLLSINWLPLGGFVRLQGEYDSSSGKGDYGAASFWQKTKILLAGVLMNLVVAAVLFTILAWTGLPKIIPDQFSVASDSRVTSSPVALTTVASGSAAEAAAFEAGDEIISINDQPVVSSQGFIEQTRAERGNEVTIVYERDGNEQSAEVKLGNDAEKGIFGAGIGQREYIHATWSAPIVGVVTTGQLSWATLEGVGSIAAKAAASFFMQFSGSDSTRQQASKNFEEVSSSVAGPVGILGVIFPSAQQQGVTQLVLLTAIISLTLAVMNALPIPALDGGRWFTMLIFRLLKKPLTKEIEERIQGIGFMVILGLIVLVTVADVSKFMN